MRSGIPWSRRFTEVEGLAFAVMFGSVVVFAPVVTSQACVRDGASEARAQEPSTLAQDSVIQKQRGTVEALEKEVGALRTALKQELNPDPVDLSIAARRAMVDLDQARKTAEVAQIAVKEYENGIYPQEEQTAEGNVKLAESALVKAKDSLEYSNKMVAEGFHSKAKNFEYKLAMEKAEFALKEAQTKLSVLKIYTKQKQLAELREAVNKANVEVSIKEKLWEAAQAREAANGAGANQAKPNSTEEQVVSLLGQAGDLESRVLALVREAADVQAKAGDNADKVRAAADRLRQIHDDVKSLKNQAKLKLEAAVGTAEKVHAKRVALRAKEDELKRAHEELDRLEGRTSGAQKEAPSRRPRQ
jgi:hypothetical protein